MDDVVRDRQLEYKSAQTLPPLEIPPDLSRAGIEDRMVVPDTAAPTGTATLSTYAGERSGPEPAARGGVLPVVEGMRVVRDGDERWLVVKGDPAGYWERVRSFWLGNGFTLKVDNPTAGIMETDWAENRADIPHSVIRSLLGKLIDAAYSTATRDRFRTRLERGPDGTTEIFISHRGAEEVVQSGVSETTVWQPRPSDPELEAEMLNRLMVFLGARREQADRMLATTTAQAPRARLERDAAGAVSLVLEDDYARAWRRVGLTLDRVGFTVEDRDRSRGLYFVRYVDPATAGQKPGFFDKLKFWGEGEAERKTEYLISLQGQVPPTRVVILDKGGARDNSETAGRILSLLETELK
jgi:outer membrane protein assembly factor BamC